MRPVHLKAIGFNGKVQGSSRIRWKGLQLISEPHFYRGGKRQNLFTASFTESGKPKTLFRLSDETTTYKKKISHFLESLYESAPGEPSVQKLIVVIGLSEVGLPVWNYLKWGEQNVTTSFIVIKQSLL